MAALEGRVYRGPDGVRQWLGDLARDWEYFQPVYEEYRDLGDRVLVLGRWRARGRVSGVELENQPAAWLYEIKDGKVVRMRTFTDRAEALEAVGLSESLMSQENVEVVKASVAAWNAGDTDALRELFDPDAILRSPEGWPEPGPFVGREAVMRQYRQMRETWDFDAVELVSDYIDVGDRVAVRFTWRTSGQGPESNMELTIILTVRKAGSLAWSTSGITRRPSKPWGCGTARSDAGRLEEVLLVPRAGPASTGAVRRRPR